MGEHERVLAVAGAIRGSLSEAALELEKETVMDEMFVSPAQLCKLYPLCNGIQKRCVWEVMRVRCGHEGGALISGISVP